MDLMLQILFFFLKKGTTVHEDEPTGMSSEFMVSGGGSLQSHLLDASATRLQDAWTAWGLLRKESDHRPPREPGSIMVTHGDRGLVFRPCCR